MFKRGFPAQDLSARPVSLIALFPVCLGSRPAAPFPGGGRGKMKIAISRHAVKLHGPAAASPAGEAPLQGPGPTGAPAFPSPCSGDTWVSLSCGFGFFMPPVTCSCVCLGSSQWCEELS